MTAYCPHCHSKLTFDPTIDGLRCPDCGYNEHISDKPPIRDRDDDRDGLDFPIPQMRPDNEGVDDLPFGPKRGQGLAIGPEDCLHDALERSRPPNRKGDPHALVCPCPKCTPLL